jgi:hypothetical protein
VRGGLRRISLKVHIHKIENFFGSDFEFFVIYAQIVRFCKKTFFDQATIGEIQFFRVV